MTKERAYWLAWSQVSGLGHVLINRLNQNFGTLSEAWIAPTRDLRAVEGFGEKLISKIQEMRSQLQPQEFLAQHSQENPHFWTPADVDYPKLLLEIPSPPLVLYYRGVVETAENSGLKPIIAIVGTRQPTEHGKRWTAKISKLLTQSGFSIISGMALGIDGIAHKACLEAQGRTIAVVGTGLDIIYPYEHRQLYQDIQKQGLIISEYPVKTQPKKGNFPARNRIIGGLSRAVLVMEAPEKSGSLITARFANEFGRDIYVLPNSPECKESHGCLNLLKDGANIIFKEDELIEMLGGIPQFNPVKQLSLFASENNSKNLDHLTPDLLMILKAIATDLTPFDVIVQQTGLSTDKVLAGLSQLEIEDLVIQLAGMNYQRLVHF